jgi:hypothetical protein
MEHVMTTAVSQRAANGRPPAEIMESVLIKGDLAKLTPEQRSDYYGAVCKSVGLNPLTKPFEYITLNGRLTLYALRTCTDQLRAIHKVSVVEMTEGERDGVFIVTAKVANGEGRTDIAKGAVNISKLQGEALANALMKAETKAKRRATLSICGLGFLDETEIEDIPEKRQNPHVTRPDDVVDPPPPDDPDAIPRMQDYPGVKRLPKKDCREDTRKFQDEMHAITDPDELVAWGKKQAKRIRTYPEDWEEIARGRHYQHLQSLRSRPKAQPIKSDEPPTDPEQFLKWVDGVFAGFGEATLLEAGWNYLIEPHMGKLLPPDQDEALAIYHKHETRLANG